jgi:hypothetical protein
MRLLLRVSGARVMTARLFTAFPGAAGDGTTAVSAAGAARCDGLRGNASGQSSRRCSKERDALPTGGRRGVQSAGGRVEREGGGRSAMEGDEGCSEAANGS